MNEHKLSPAERRQLLNRLMHYREPAEVLCDRSLPEDYEPRPFTVMRVPVTEADIIRAQRNSR